MTTARIETPFGEVMLSSPVGVAGDPARAPSGLPEQLRVDGCLTATLNIAFGAGQEVEVTLVCDVRSAKAHRTGGDDVTGWEVETPDLAGAFGLPGPKAMERLGLRVAGYAEAKAGITLRLHSETAQVAAIPFAAAWTLNPDEETQLAPWLALERALPDAIA